MAAMEHANRAIALRWRCSTVLCVALLALYLPGFGDSSSSGPSQLAKYVDRSKGVSAARFTLGKRLHWEDEEEGEAEQLQAEGVSGSRHGLHLGMHSSISHEGASQPVLASQHRALRQARNRRGVSKLYQLPWLMGEGEKFRYQGAQNNLSRICKVQSKNNWVTVFLFSTPVKRWALNAIYSYVRFGKSRAYIVATMDEQSLQECMALRLPCYNATHALAQMRARAEMAAVAGGGAAAGVGPGAGREEDAVVAQARRSLLAQAMQESGDDVGLAAAAGLGSVEDREVMLRLLKESEGEEGVAEQLEHQAEAGAAGSSGAGHGSSAAGFPDLAELATKRVRALLERPAPSMHGSDLRAQRVRRSLQAAGAEGTGSIQAGGGGGSGGGSGGSGSGGTTYNIGSRDYYCMVWAKVIIAKEVLQLGYNVHFSDVDVVYLREVVRSYKQLVLRYRADAVFMKENVVELEDPNNPFSRVTKVNLVNTGIYYMRSTNTTLKLVEDWLTLAGPAILANRHDQAVFNAMAFKHYIVCAGATSCIGARAAGFPTVYRHPQQFGLQVCPSAFMDPCDPIRLFVHAVCTVGWGEDERGKGSWWKKFKLWLVDEEGQPLYATEDDAEGGPAAAAQVSGLGASLSTGSRRRLRVSSGAGAGKGIVQGGARPQHPFLPCQGPAWSGAYGEGGGMELGAGAGGTR